MRDLYTCVVNLVLTAGGKTKTKLLLPAVYYHMSGALNATVLQRACSCCVCFADDALSRNALSLKDREYSVQVVMNQPPVFPLVRRCQFV